MKNGLVLFVTIVIVLFAIAVLVFLVIPTFNVQSQAAIAESVRRSENLINCIDTCTRSGSVYEVCKYRCGVH